MLSLNPEDSMSEEKLVSVCINAYNRADVIEETIESVLNQTYKNLQIIVVDDGSTDNTAEIVKSFDDGRIELYVLPKNSGISNSNNECLHRASGEYIAHLDSDDIWLPDKIEKQVKFLEENPRYGACFSYAGFIDENSNILTEEHLPLYHLNVYVHENMPQSGFVRSFFDKSNHICHCSMVMRKSVYEKLGDHDLTMNYLHDFDCWVRMNFLCPFYIIPEKLVLCRIWRANNSTLGERELIAHNEEYARIMYKLINDCPNDMFADAFSDRFRLEGAHTNEELELEKAFVLGDALPMLPENKVLEIKKLDELFRDKKYIDLAEEKFGFTIADFHNLRKNEIYYNKPESDSLKSRNAELERSVESKDAQLKQESELCAAQQEEIRSNRQKYEELSGSYNELRQSFDSLSAEHARLAAQYNLILNSKSYKITAPLRKIKSFF